LGRAAKKPPRGGDPPAGRTPPARPAARAVSIYDTTLRDGSQAEDVSFSVGDKLRIAERLDDFGVAYIEGGFPGSNPRDEEFFREAARLKLGHARLAAFGSTRKAKNRVGEDDGIRALLRAGTPVVTIFGKSWDLHVTDALRIDLGRNLELIADSVAYLKGGVDEVFFDAEHFFDGYKRNPAYALDTLEAAAGAGADCLVLCDTNGGLLPHEIVPILEQVRLRLPGASLGIHVHNDAETAVANTLMAVAWGVRHVQGTINGIGERCGNANLCSIIPAAQCKLGLDVVPPAKLAGLRGLSRFVDELANLAPLRHQPYVGDSAFAHKGGVHVSAVGRNPETYEHLPPETVGNRSRVLVSDLSGTANILHKAAELDLHLPNADADTRLILEKLKELEHKGFQFEGAEASFEILSRKILGTHQRFFDLKGARVIVEKRREGEACISEATIKVAVGGVVEHTAAEGDGPVNALDNALRKALEKFYPMLREVRLVDFKVRVLTAQAGTAAQVRVLIDSGDGTDRWGTVGVSENIIEASWQALVDSIEYKLIKDGVAGI
jgi:2-isopropylmalate synthase